MLWSREAILENNGQLSQIDFCFRVEEGDEDQHQYLSKYHMSPLFRGF